MRENRHQPITQDTDHRPLVLLVIGLSVIILHLWQWLPFYRNTFTVPPAPPVFAWLHNQQGEGIYRFPASTAKNIQKTTADLPNRVRLLFFQPVSINKADRQSLTVLPGIGPVLADHIVSHRETHGYFNSPRDLLKVNGIGPGKLESIRNLLVFE